MKVAIMQPYLFPYIGYFQLIKAVDAFVVYDDVSYRQREWINRNYIIAAEGRQLFSMPVSGGSSNNLINQVEVLANNVKLLKTLRHRYARAPYFETVFPLISDILTCSEKNLAIFLNNQLKKICEYLQLRPSWILSSAIDKNNDLRGQEKVLDICGQLGATQYINLPGGRTLYDSSAFSQCDIKLSFLQPKPIIYKQFRLPFEPNLSIIDVLMFNGRDTISCLLEEFDIA